MSDDPKKESEAVGKKKGSSSGRSKPNLFPLQNSEPSSNPVTLSALGRSSGNDKKIKNGLKAALPGAVAQSTSASNGKSMSTQNTLTEFVSGIEGTKGSNYRRRTITSPRFISEPIIATTRVEVNIIKTYSKIKQKKIKTVSSSLADNKAKNKSNTAATAAITKF